MTGARFLLLGQFLVLLYTWPVFNTIQVYGLVNKCSSIGILVLLWLLGVCTHRIETCRDIRVYAAELITCHLGNHMISMDREA